MKPVTKPITSRWEAIKRGDYEGREAVRDIDTAQFARDAGKNARIMFWDAASHGIVEEREPNMWLLGAQAIDISDCPLAHRNFFVLAYVDGALDEAFRVYDALMEPTDAA